MHCIVFLPLLYIHLVLGEGICHSRREQLLLRVATLTRQSAVLPYHMPPQPFLKSLVEEDKVQVGFDVEY